MVRGRARRVHCLESFSVDTITHRKSEILRLIVTDYISSATPVGSTTIVKDHGLKVSPATVRNEMVKLEEEGYILRPHTSAGGVPSDKGYRYFVERLPREALPPRSVSWTLQTELEHVRRDMEQWAKAVSAVMSNIVGTLAFATAPRSNSQRVKQLELVYLQDLTALLVLIMHGASVHKLLLPLSEPATPGRLEEVRNRTSAMLTDRTAAEIEAARPQSVSPLESDVLNATLDVLRTDEAASVGDYVLDGLAELFSQPEFAQGGGGREILDVVENEEGLSGLATKAPDDGSVAVFIGSEMEFQSMRTFSVVVSRYGIPGEAMGTLGLMGPTRLEYQLAMPLVRQAANLLSGLVTDIFPDSPPPASGMQN